MREQFRSGDHSSVLGGRPQGQGGSLGGEIIDQDDKSITVKLPDGGSRIIFVSDSTQINQSAPATRDDLTKGTQLFVTGSENPDGSVNATRIQVGELGDHLPLGD